MKITLAFILLVSINSFAAPNSFCNDLVKNTAAKKFSDDFKNEKIKLVDADVINYVGPHTKRYVSKVVSLNKAALYEIIVGEFETPETDCVVDKIVRL